MSSGRLVNSIAVGIRGLDPRWGYRFRSHNYVVVFVGGGLDCWIGCLSKDAYWE